MLLRLFLLLLQRYGALLYYASFLVTFWNIFFIKLKNPHGWRAGGCSMWNNLAAADTYVGAVISISAYFVAYPVGGYGLEKIAFPAVGIKFPELPALLLA